MISTPLCQELLHAVGAHVAAHKLMAANHLGSGGPSAL